MSWRAVEMQVALPRTQDAGQLQEQLQQRGQNVQNHIAEAHLKEEQLRRKKVNELSKTDKQKLSNDLKEGQNQSEELSLPTKKKQKKNNDTKFSHPFLGNKIDYNG